MARDFSGSASDFLEVGDVAAIDITGQALTVSAWIQPDVINTNQSYVAKYANTENQYALSITSAGKAQLVVLAGEIIDGATTLSQFKWQHTLGVKDGGNVRIYLNGKLDGSAASAGSMADTTAPLRFGRLGGTTTNPYDGRIADVAIWNTPLFPIEIDALAAGVSPLKIRPGNLKGYWPLDDYGASGQSLDRSIFNNSAAMTGAVGLVPAVKTEPSIEERERINLSVPYIIKRPGSVFRVGTIQRPMYKSALGARNFPNNAANYLRVGDVPAVDIIGDRISFSAWVNPDASQAHTILSKRNDATTIVQYEFYLLSNGVVGFIIGNGGGGIDNISGGSSVTVGKWSHVAAVKKGTAGTTMWVFADAKEVVSASAGITMADTSQPLDFGKISTVTGGGNPFNGRIAHIAIWNDSLTHEEVRRLAAGASPLTIRPGNLRGYWPLNDYGESGVARDLSQHRNDAAMTGAVPLLGSPIMTEEGIDYLTVAGEKQLGAHIDYVAEGIAA